MHRLIYLLIVFSYLQAYAQIKVDWNSGGWPSIAAGQLRESMVQWSGELPLESFESHIFPPVGWKKATGYGGIGWQRGEAGEQIIGFGPGSVIDTPLQGGNFVAYASWGTGDADRSLSTGQPTEQWLITPQVMNIQPGDTLEFYLRYFFKYGDSLDVWLSTTTDSLKAFEILVAKLGFIGQGNNEWRRYRYILSDFVAPGSNIYIGFREHVVNTAEEGDALFLDLVKVSPFVTAVSEIQQRSFTLAQIQNYPNPFNSMTHIQFSIPQQSWITLKVYDTMGQLVKTLVNGETFAAGEHTIPFGGDNFASGIYYCQIQANDFIAAKKMILLK